MEQILALLVTEKFLQILPADMESSASMRSLETRERLFTLIEELRRDNREAENNVRTSGFVVLRPKQMPRQLRQDESFCPCHSTVPTLPQSPFQRCFFVEGSWTPHRGHRLGGQRFHPRPYLTTAPSLQHTNGSPSLSLNQILGLFYHLKTCIDDQMCSVSVPRS